MLAQVVVLPVVGIESVTVGRSRSMRRVTLCHVVVSVVESTLEVELVVVLVVAVDGR